MTNSEARGLVKGDRVYFNNDPWCAGTVTSGAEYDAREIEIEWDDLTPNGSPISQYPTASSDHLRYLCQLKYADSQQEALDSESHI
jgi:hypothetical protein